jgi:DNA-binding transcriptional ArsR family regulator
VPTTREAPRTRTHREADASALIAAKLFRGLADPTRLGILRALQAGERRVTDLVAEVGGSQANASGHLACLKDCGLAAGRAQGRPGPSWPACCAPPTPS